MITLNHDQTRIEGGDDAPVQSLQLPLDPAKPRRAEVLPRVQESLLEPAADARPRRRAEKGGRP
jgi:hypothetical protein